MCIEYDEQINALKITSTNFETMETAVNVQLGSIGELEKFNKDTVGAYVAQAWGGALPVYNNKIGFIFSKADLDIRKHLLTEEEYSDILTTYPKLNSVENTRIDVYNVKVVSAGVSAELDIVTGKPKENSESTLMVDNELAGWYSKLNVPKIDATQVLPEDIVKLLEETNNSMPQYVDPIQKDIWKKFGSK